MNNDLIFVGAKLHYNWLIVLFFLVIFSQPMVGFSQHRYDLVGILQVHKKSIAYRLTFLEQNGNIQGYSITDIGGRDETKTTIVGSYDRKHKTLDFQEREILYTKSTFKEHSFCFVHFSGQARLENSIQKLEGAFSGLYKNKTKCIDGTITLAGRGKMYGVTNKANKKILQPRKIHADSLTSNNILSKVDSLKTTKLSQQENINLFWQSSELLLDIWDNEKQDGDVVNVYQNDTLILSAHEVKTSRKTIKIALKGKVNVFRVLAVNEGSIKPNTTKLALRDETRNVELLAVLRQGESTSITIMQQEKH